MRLDLTHYFAAVRAGDLKFVAKHVSKCNVHLVDGYTQTFLHWASYAGNEVAACVCVKLISGQDMWKL